MPTTRLMPTGTPGIPVSFSAKSASTAAIPAVIYDGVGDYLKHTGGPTGAADGRRFTFVIGYTKASDGSAMTLLDIPGTTPFKVEIQSDNTIDAVAGTAGAVASCSTTETTLAADGFSVAVVQLDQDHLSIDLRNSDAQYAGTNTPGTAADIDFTADWYLGSDGGASNFFDGNIHFIWAHADYIGGGDAEFVEQFYDTTNDKMRDLGSNGSNPLGGVTQPILCHADNSSTHTTNRGSGGNADAGSNSGDDTSPGQLADALTNGFDLLLGAAGWWSADHSANTVATGFSQLTDRTASDADVAQATGTLQPLRTDTSGIISAEYDVTDDSMSVTSTAIDNHFNGGGGLIVVFRPDDASTARRVIDKEGASGGWIAFVENETGANCRVEIQIRYSGADIVLESATDVALAAIHVWDVTFDADQTDATDAEFFIDGTQYTEGGSPALTTADATGTNTTDTGAAYFGNRVDGLRPLDGGFYEAAMLDTEPTTAQMARIRTHMARKYGVTLS